MAGVEIPPSTALMRRSTKAVFGGTACAARRGKHELHVAAVVHVMQRFQRRRGGAEHDGYARLLGADYREIARGVPEPTFVLLVRSIVLFVHDDDAEITYRCEDGRASAEHDRASDR